MKVDPKQNIKYAKKLGIHLIKQKFPIVDNNPDVIDEVIEETNIADSYSGTIYINIARREIKNINITSKKQCSKTVQTKEFVGLEVESIQNQPYIEIDQRFVIKVDSSPADIHIKKIISKEIPILAVNK
jgi:hypothetical protein